MPPESAAQPATGTRLPQGLPPEPPAPARQERWVRYLPWGGVALGAVDLAFLAAVWLAQPNQLPFLLLTIPLLFLAGKEAAIPAGIAAGGSIALVATTMILTDTAATLVLYPIVHLTLDTIERRRGFLGKMLRGAVRRAQRRRHIVDRFGVAGLYLFAIIPFAFNGPPICAALGRLAGLRARQVVPVLVAAIVTTTTAWSIFYDLGFKALANVNHWIPLGISLAVMATMVTIGIVGAMLDKSESGPPA